MKNRCENRKTTFGVILFAYFTLLPFSEKIEKSMQKGVPKVVCFGLKNDLGRPRVAWFGHLGRSGAPKDRKCELECPTRVPLRGWRGPYMRFGGFWWICWRRAGEFWLRGRGIFRAGPGNFCRGAGAYFSGPGTPGQGIIPYSVALIPCAFTSGRRNYYLILFLVINY